MAGPLLIERILLATEHTQFDAGAEATAVELARALPAALRVVMPVAGNPEFQVVAPQLADAAEETAARAVAALSEQARRANVRFEAHVRSGDDAWREIVDEARESHAGLLVVRRIGHRGTLARLIVGEMMSQVAAHAPCPVLMVAATGRELWSRRVVALVDAQGIDLAAANLAVELAAAVRAPLLLIGRGDADTPGENIAASVRQRVEQIMQARGVDAAWDIGAVGRLDDLPGRVRAAGGDLLVIGLTARDRAHGRLSKAVENLVGAVDCSSVLVGASS